MFWLRLDSQKADRACLSLLDHIQIALNAVFDNCQS